MKYSRTQLCNLLYYLLYYMKHWFDISDDYWPVLFTHTKHITIICGVTQSWKVMILFKRYWGFTLCLHIKIKTINTVCVLFELMGLFCTFCWICTIKSHVIAVPVFPVTMDIQTTITCITFNTEEKKQNVMIMVMAGSEVIFHDYKAHGSLSPMDHLKGWVPQISTVSACLCVQIFGYIPTTDRS